MTDSLFAPQPSDPVPAASSASVPLPPAAVLPVGLLVSSARLLIERHLGLVWVSGEISNFTRAASGHCYFNLKDAQAQARCVLFRQKAQHVAFAMRDGLQVEVRATPSIYEARGEFQLNVENVRLAGIGALYEKFAQLKAKLDAAGWFAAARKRPIPNYPRAIGIVTSIRAAALRDILATLARRWPSARVIVYPASVQGAGAALEIAQAIALANERREVDVLIVGRGGGSIEDLWAFNEEAAARAVHDSLLPIVAGIGHETDFTICDFVADLRAPTPTGAAAAVTPDRVAMAHRVVQVARRIARCGEHALALRLQRVDVAARRLVHPAAYLALQADRARELARRLTRAWHSRGAARDAATTTLSARLLRELRSPSPQALHLMRASADWQRQGRDQLSRVDSRLHGLAQNLAHLNPQAVLTRGYAMVAGPDGTLVRDASVLHAEDALAITFAQGGAAALVTSTHD